MIYSDANYYNEEEKKDNGKKRDNVDEVVSLPSKYVVYQPVHNCLINVVHAHILFTQYIIEKKEPDLLSAAQD